MIGFRARQVVIADNRQAPAASSVFASGPAQARIKVISTVHEHSAGFDLVSDFFRTFSVFGPDRGSQAVLTVIHHGNGLGVVLDRHDTNDRTKTFLSHDLHIMSHAC